MLDDLQYMHPWTTSSIHLHGKTVPCCFLHPNKLLSTEPLHKHCKNQQSHTVEGLHQPTKGSGLTEWNPVKCAFSEHTKISTNLPSGPRENSGITQGWHWAGTPSLREYRGTGPCEPWSVMPWGSLLTVLIWMILSTLQDSALFYPSADHWH